MCFVFDNEIKYENMFTLLPRTNCHLINVCQAIIANSIYVPD